MKARVIVAVGTSVVLLAACGGGGGKQDEVADMLLEQMEGEDIELDEDCVRDAAGELSDDDAQKILDAGPDGEAEDLSADAQAAGAALVDCIDFGDLLDDVDISIPDISIPDISIPDISIPDISSFIDDLDIEGLDEECFQAAIEDFDPASGDADELMSAAFGCVNPGG